MVDRAQPSLDNTPLARYFASAAEHAGGAADGWVIPASDDPNNLAEADSDIDHDALNAFDLSYSEDSLVVTLGPGAAFAGGAWLVRDHYTRYELDEHEGGQGLYLGWETESNDGVKVGTITDFLVREVVTLLYRFETDGSGVTTVWDNRNLDDYRIRDVDLSDSVATESRYADSHGSFLDKDMSSSSTKTESLNNTYLPGSAQLRVEKNERLGGDVKTAFWDSWGTDADGNITDVTIQYQIVDGRAAIDWTVQGVETP